jgi:LytR cell envelope-related transcriptional attenuator
MESFQEKGTDPVTSVTREDPGAGKLSEGPQSPEEAAREFFREGGVVVVDEIDEADRRRRRRLALVGGIVAVVVVAAIVAAVLLTRGSGKPPAPKAATHASTIPVAKAQSKSKSKAKAKSVTPVTPVTSVTPAVPPPSAVDVQVLNASMTNGLAGQTALDLAHNGFTVGTAGNASSKIASGDPSQILYGPSGLPAAHVLGASLSGPVSYVPTPSLTGNNVTLWVAGPQLTVITTTTTSAPTTTTTGHK